MEQPADADLGALLFRGARFDGAPPFQAFADAGAPVVGNGLTQQKALQRLERNEQMIHILLGERGRNFLHERVQLFFRPVERRRRQFPLSVFGALCSGTEFFRLNQIAPQRSSAGGKGFRPVPQPFCHAAQFLFGADKIRAPLPRGHHPDIFAGQKQQFPADARQQVGIAAPADEVSPDLQIFARSGKTVRP